MNAPEETVSLDYGGRPSALPYMLRGILPVRRRFRLSPPISARWRGHRPDPGQLAALLGITGLAPGSSTLPLLYPHIFGFRLSMAILTHPSFPVPIWSVLQTRNRFLEHRPIGAGESLDFETRVRPGRAVPKGAEFDLHTTVHADGRLAWESLVTFFVRGRCGDPDPEAPIHRAPAEAGPPIAEWTMRKTGNWSLGRFTGDYNGIHFWDGYARRFGFRGALYHPPRVLGECLARLPSLESDQGARRLDAWIKGPVHHGSSVRLHASRKPGDCVFALFAGDERPGLVGRLWVAEGGQRSLEEYQGAGHGI